MKKILLILIFFISPSVISAQVYISSLLPNPQYSRDTSEWISLTNYSIENVDLNGYILDNKKIEELSISPKETIYFTKDVDAFYSEFGRLPGIQVIELGISLPNTSDFVELENPSGQVVSEIAYSGPEASEIITSDGPICDSFNSLYSQDLEYIDYFINYECFPQGSFIEGNIIEVEELLDKGLESINIEPVAVYLNTVKNSQYFQFLTDNYIKELSFKFDDVLISSQFISDNNIFTSVFNNKYSTTIISNNFPTCIDGCSLEFISDNISNYYIIPPHPKGSAYVFTDNTILFQEKESAHPNIDPTVQEVEDLPEVSQMLEEPLPLLLTEFISNPDSALGEVEKIELYNPNQYSITTDNYSIGDTSTIKPIESFLIPAQSHLVIDSPVSLNNSGDNIKLFLKDYIVDSIIIPKANKGEYFTRMRDKDGYLNRWELTNTKSLWEYNTILKVEQTGEDSSSVLGIMQGASSSGGSTPSVEVEESSLDIDFVQSLQDEIGNSEGILVVNDLSLKKVSSSRGDYLLYIIILIFFAIVNNVDYISKKIEAAIKWLNGEISIQNSSARPKRLHPL